MRASVVWTHTGYWRVPRAQTHCSGHWVAGEGHHCGVVGVLGGLWGAWGGQWGAV